MVSGDWPYLVVLLVAAVTTSLLTRPARVIAKKVGFVSIPGDRSVHQRTTPYGGGSAMFAGLCIAMAAGALIPSLRALFVDTDEPVGVIIAALVIVIVGMVDDSRNMSAPAKIAGQVLAASVLYFAGVTMYWFKVPFGGVLVLGASVLPLITSLWVIALTNAINLIDGLDGLAAGIVAIASGALCVYGLRLEDLGLLQSTNIGPLIAAATCGICLGFLPSNYHPARLFMGDTGALLLGVLMSAATMVIGGRTPPASGVTYFFFAPLLIPFFILGVPLVDMGFAFVRRTASGQGFHNPDKDHVHHRLLRLGHGHRRTVVILWLWTALLSGMVLFPLYEEKVNVFIPFGVAAMGVGLYTWFHPGIRRGAQEPSVAVPVASSSGGPGQGVQ
jgi:UDP-GlcNAc:undecaprenyl-phosphate GlcNAc-1-phosphate transferase